MTTTQKRTRASVARLDVYPARQRVADKNGVRQYATRYNWRFFANNNELICESRQSYKSVRAATQAFEDSIKIMSEYTQKRIKDAGFSFSQVKAAEEGSE